MREIDKEDVRTAVDRARAVERPPDREILHLLPRQFILDDQPGIFDPVGMVGKKLEVDLHIATCSGSALQSTVTCANRAGLEVTEAVLESIASAEATLTADERELGVCLLDIGCHSSDLVVFFEGAVVHTASVPIGGQHFTNDLAVGLQMPMAHAEELKRRYGHAVVTAVPQDEEIEIANPQPQMLRRRRIAEILEPRACELFQFVKRKPARGRRAGRAGRRLRAHRRRRHAARNVGHRGEPVAGSGPHRSSRPPLAHARRARSSRLFHRHRHDFVRSPHQGQPRRGEQFAALQAARHLCSQFLTVHHCSHESGGRSQMEESRE